MSDFLFNAEVWDEEKSDCIGWGFVLYRQDYSDDSKWKLALERLEAYTTTFAVYNTAVAEDSPVIREKVKTMYRMPVFEDNEKFTDEKEIQKHFMEWRKDDNSIPRNRDYLVADKEAIENLSALQELSNQTPDSEVTGDVLIRIVDALLDPSEQERLQKHGPRPGIDPMPRQDAGTMKVKVNELGRLWSALENYDWEE
jgi:hypothetical protein